MAIADIFRGVYKGDAAAKSHPLLITLDGLSVYTGSCSGSAGLYSGALINGRMHC